MLRRSSYQHPAWAITALAIAAVLSTSAWPADKKETREREAQRRIQQAVKQAQTKNAQLEQENKDLANKLKEQEQHVQETRNSAEGFSRKNKRLTEDFAKEQARAADLDARLQQAESELQQTRGKLAEITASQLETQNRLKATVSEKATLGESFTVCLGKNERLYQLGRELINHVERPAGFAGALRSEPFTQIKRVELENIFQDYRDEVDQNQIKQSPPKHSSRSDIPR